MLPGLLGSSPAGGSSAGYPTNPVGGELASFSINLEENVHTSTATYYFDFLGRAGLVDGVGSLLPLGPGSQGGGLNDLLNGVPTYNPAASAAGPGRPAPPAAYGDAPWVSTVDAPRFMIDGG